jgi:hypothetical protein
MQASNIPVKFPVAFASSAGAGFIRSVPQNPTGTPGQASLTVGFPPENFNAVAAGGTPPFGQDFNGLLNQITAWNQWVSAGGGVPIFDGTFSTAIGGYPAGAFLQANGNPGHFWISLVDNNTVNPDSGFSLQWMPFPNVLIANRTFFVNGSTGNDSWDGTSATFVSGTTGPWATLQHAASQVAIYNLNSFNITINIANGSFPLTSPVTWPAQTGSGQVLIVGNHGSPSSVPVSNATGTCFVFGAGSWVVDGLQFTVSGTSGGDPGNCIFAGIGASVNVKAANFGPATNAHMESGTNGSIVITGPITINSGANAAMHIFSSTNALLGFPSPAGGLPNLTVAGPVTFSIAFAYATKIATINGYYYSGTTGGGNVTGPRYLVQSNAVIDANGGGASAFPGTVAGSTQTGGQYLP